MQAKQLMDSRRFCQLMDDLAATWKKRASTDEDKAWRLQAVLDHLGETGGSMAPVAPIKSLSEAMADAVNSFKEEAPLKGFPPPTEDERFKSLMKDLVPYLDKVAPNGQGERIAPIPLEVDVNALSGWLDVHKEYPYFMDMDGTINVGNSMNPMGGWQMPFKRRGVS